MLCVNDGGETDSWVRPDDPRDPFYKDTRGLQPILQRCHRITQTRSRMEDGMVVFAPSGDRMLQRAIIDDSIEHAHGLRYAGTRIVRFIDDETALSVAEGRLVKVTHHIHTSITDHHVPSNHVPPLHKSSTRLSPRALHTNSFYDCRSYHRLLDSSRGCWV